MALRPVRADQRPLTSHSRRIEGVLKASSSTSVACGRCALGGNTATPVNHGSILNIRIQDDDTTDTIHL